jgi:hypothetical protein
VSSAVVRAGIDAWAAQNAPTTNYGASRYLFLSSGATTRYAYLWLKSPAPLKSTVTKATLRVYGAGNWGAGAVPVAVQRIASTWKVGQLNWNNKPGVAGAIVTKSAANTVDGQLWEFDVTTLMQTIATGATNYGLRISATTTAYHAFYSLDDATYKPTLEVAWSDAPDTPHTLSPGGSRAVSLAQPTLNFDYVDVSGSVALAACQVQIDPAGNFTTPAWDSGAIPVTESELDLTTTTYPGLALNATTKWRVRVQDGAGLWSGWSDAATFTRIAPPNAFVSEWTPPIIWSFTGQTQKAWLIRVANFDNPARYLFNTGWRTSATDNSFTLPAGVLTTNGDVYDVELFIQDRINREATSGDPAYVYIRRPFTYKEDGTPNPVTHLTFTDFGDRPYAQLNWQRSTAPDYFAVLRDGHVAGTNLLPDDLITGGTSYQWVDQDAAGNVPHTWVVQAYVNTKGSSGNPSVKGTIVTPAIWLTDTTSNRLVALLAAEQVDFSMPDSATVYEPIEADAVVRVTQAQRGMEGSISGLITTYAGAANTTFVSNMFWFKARPQLPLRLTIGSMNLRVILGNVTIAPTPNGDVNDRAVSFDFWSLDGVTT